MNKNAAVTVALVLLVGVGGFYGGMTYQKSQSPANGFGQFGGRMGQGGPGGPGGYGGMGRNGFGRPVAGQIIEKDATSITVKMQDGSTKIVLLSNSATINKATKATKDDLKKGENVTVMGTTNSDGSVTANNINLGDFRMGHQEGDVPPGQFGQAGQSQNQNGNQSQTGQPQQSQQQNQGQQQ
jgi:hypothetical protein